MELNRGIFCVLFAFFSITTTISESEKFITCEYDFASQKKEPRQINFYINCSTFAKTSKHIDVLNAQPHIKCNKDNQMWYAGKDKFLLFQSDEINQIRFRGCRMPRLPRKFLELLQTVRAIDLERSGVEVINGDIFPLGNIFKQLIIPHNSITELPAFLCENATKLELFDLSYNRIDKIHPTAFKGTEQTLKLLKLQNNRIKRLEKDTFANLTSLKLLDLNDNLMKVFQADLSTGHSMMYLFLKNNRLTRLDCNAFFNSSLDFTFIDASGNHLKEVNWNCNTNCSSLGWTLNINDNRLERLVLPSSQLVKTMSSLYASRNNIKEVSIASDLNSLLELKLAANNLTNIPKIQCDSLEELDLSFNKISQLDDDSFENLPNLERLYLQNNNISRIDYEAFTQTTRLRRFNISHNNLDKFNFSLFMPKFTHLDEIFLRGNRLKELTGWSNSFLGELQVLSISNNEFNCSYLDRFFRNNPDVVSWVVDPSMPKVVGENNVHGITCFDIDEMHDSQMLLIKDELKQHMTNLSNKLNVNSQQLSQLAENLSSLNDRITNLEKKINDDLQKVITVLNKMNSFTDNSTETTNISSVDFNVEANDSFEELTQTVSSIALESNNTSEQNSSTGENTR